MKHLCVGVLGHVDHGKTSLVKALTGTDTDRLKEEKERGISIVLGFADLTLSGGRVAFVDVPGHERFVRTMVSGATGISAVLLAVSACEGVKPQTVEHLDIAALLGLRRGIVALTQCDRVSLEARAEAVAELRRYLANTFLADAPIVETSVVTREGLDALRSTLDTLVGESEEIEDEGFAYLPVDRVFALPGAGVIVTGTLQRGSFAEGDELEIYPHGTRAIVRQVQSHGERVGRGLPGRRTAVNLRNADREGIARGDVLAHPGTLQLARFLDVELSVLASASQALRDGERLRVLFGTTETFGRFHELDHDDIPPGETRFGRIQLDAPAPVLARERFIVRSYSPIHTIGGGSILGAQDQRMRRSRAEERRIAEVLSRADLGDVLSMRCALAEPSPLDLRAFAICERFALERVQDIARASRMVEVGGGVVRREAIEALEQAALSGLDKFQREDGLAAGLSVEELQGRLEIATDTAVLVCALERLCERGVLSRVGGKFGIGDTRASVGLNERDRALYEEIESAFRAGALESPSLPEVIRDEPDRFRVYKHLVSKGVLVALHASNKPRNFGNTIAFHAEAVESARQRLVARFGESRFETAQAKEFLGISRKYLIPLLEHLDARGHTRRTGEARIFVKRKV